MGQARSGSGSPRLAVFFYLQNIPPLFPIIAGFPHTLLLGHFWSLAVEEQFYLIWPILLWATRKSAARARWCCLLVWTLSLIFRFAVFGRGLNPDWSYSALPGRAGELAMGGYLALAMRDRSVKAALLRHVQWIFPASAVAMIGVMICAGNVESETFPMVTLGLGINAVLFASLVALCLRQGFVASFFSAKWLRWLGKISYGIYVYHVLFKNQFDKFVSFAFPSLDRNAHLLVLAGVGAIGTLAIASLSFYGFETKFLRLKNRIA
ncbi:MAG: acyltransferase [Acidobacteriaceae bacterium]